VLRVISGVTSLMQELSLNNCRLDKRYDVSEQLGRGSYAEIYLARDIMASTHSPHSQVVVKALNVFLQNDLDAGLERTLVENFQNEAIALDRVRHPNVISRIGHGTARDLKGTVFHYLVIEYLSGGDLQSLLRKQAIPLTQALSYIEQVCAGLGYAHRRGVIHRDIKPQNLLLTADLRTVKIADFGVARVSAADSPITRVGTNIYAPPEHSPMSAGQTGDLANTKLTPAADIYSLAKTIYTLLTRDAPRQFANRQVTEMPESVREQEWKDELERVVRKATANEPLDRHQSVEEFWTDLSAVREIALDGEYSTTLSANVAVPQPHVSRGYSPIAPAMPSFEAIADTPQAPVSASVTASVPSEHEREVPVRDAANNGSIVSIDIEQPPVKKLKRRPARRVGAFLVFVCLFTGILYGTASYMRGRGVLPELRNPFRNETAVANTDIYLRPGPNTDNEPIGLVTKNSKVRIVNTQNNWYQVDVVQQGRVRPSQANATRGWLNGRYLDISEN
jgi:serine/threonine-protein kinase